MATQLHYRRLPTAGRASAGPDGQSYWGRLWSHRGTKITMGILGGILLLPVIFMVLVVLGINPIFTAAVEKLGFDSLHVPVWLQGARVSFSGKLVLDRFTIANPSTFKPGDAVSIHGLYAEIPLSSIFNREIDIPVLTVDHPVFNLEFGAPDQPSNWSVIMKNLAESLPRRGVSDDGEKTFKIGELKILSPVLHYQSPTFPKGLDLHLKDVELKKVGNAPGSSSKAYLIFASLFQAILTGGVKDKHLPSDVAGRLRDELAAAAKAFGKYLESTK